MKQVQLICWQVGLGQSLQSQKSMIEELMNREKMNFGVINILLQFVMLKEDMKLPKSYIFEIASNWNKRH